MKLAILFLLACAAWGQPQPVMRGTSAAKPALPGPGILIIPVSEGELHSLDTAAVQKMILTEVAAALKSGTIATSAPLKGSGSLDFPPIADGTCSGDMNFPLAGAVEGDALAYTWPYMGPGVYGAQMRVMGPGMVAVSICNHSGKTVDPPVRMYGAAVVR